MKNLTIDAHLHVYPNLDDRFLKKANLLPFGKNELLSLLNYTDKKRQVIKNFLRPFSHHLNFIDTLANKTRELPENLIPYADRLQSLLWLKGIILEGSFEDLKYQMTENQVDYSVIIAHPPLIPNEFVINLANNFDCLIPIVNIEPCKSGNKILENFIKMGAKGLKIHAASDGLDVFDQHYLNILEVANDHKLPVIIHTGNLNIKPFYKDPDMGHAEHFQTWFTKYPDCKFILAHMNIHYPNIAIELCQLHKNVYTDTSWQPKDSIYKAVQTVGADKIMFGTDWPIMGNNIEIGLRKIDSLVKENKITFFQSQQIKGFTAAEVFNISY